MTAWVLASEAEPVDEGSSPACAVPAGTVHALAGDRAATPCGLPATALVAWPELAWPPSGMLGVDTCPECLAQAQG